MARGTSAIAFIADYDGTISRSYGADAGPRTIVLDPMLRAIATLHGMTTAITRPPCATFCAVYHQLTIPPACR
ncbi:MAG: hypothetical protein WA776_21745 [Xanthobacteraceae bacterium]